MKRLLMVGGPITGFLFVILVVLVGCTSNFSGIDQLKTMAENPPLVSNITTTGNSVGLGVSSSINPGQSISGYLDDRGLDGYGDMDWYLLNGVATGSSITVELTGSNTGDFDLAIWRDEAWVAYDDSSSSSARLNNTAGSTTWIWVGIWSGRGGYTLKVNSVTSGACSGGRLEEPVSAHLAPYIRKACYDNGVWTGAGMHLFLTPEARSRGCGSLSDDMWCRIFAIFVVSSKFWRGDRSLDSVTLEIFYHARADSINPIHIEYKCEDLGWHKVFFGC